MSSWEIALTFGLGIIPFFLHGLVTTLEKKIKNDRGIIGILVFFMNMTIFTFLIRLGVMIAELNNANIAILMNRFFLTWLILTITLFILFVGVYIPMVFFMKDKGEDDEKQKL